MFRWLKKLLGTTPPPPSSSGGSRAVRTKPAPPATYRPSGRASGTASIKFQTTATAGSTGLSPSLQSLSDINDAFTGGRLDTSQPVYECLSCHVYYQASSVEVLREHNQSRCMVCGSTQISRFGLEQPRGQARNHTPGAVTLQTYRAHIGQVITFTGHVHDVKRSRRGTDFAVMFENTSWTRGLKMVAFRGGVRKIGGEATLLGYKGRTLTIRGLLIRDPVYGPEIIVDDPSMILRVQP
jgi:hypothetical protein